MTFFQKASRIEVKVMKEMFEASVDGEAYDMDRFGQYFRPAGMAARTGDPDKSGSTLQRHQRTSGIQQGSTSSNCSSS